MLIAAVLSRLFRQPDYALALPVILLSSEWPTADRRAWWRPLPHVLIRHCSLAPDRPRTCRGAFWAVACLDAVLALARGRREPRAADRTSSLARWLRRSAAESAWLETSLLPDISWWCARGIRRSGESTLSESRVGGGASGAAAAARRALWRPRGRAARRHRSLFRRLRAVRRGGCLSQGHGGCAGAVRRALRHRRAVGAAGQQSAHGARHAIGDGEQSARDAEGDRRDHRSRRRRGHGLPRKPRQPRPSSCRPNFRRSSSTS